jgi:hypothetical protein
MHGCPVMASDGAIWFAGFLCFYSTVVYLMEEFEMMIESRWGTGKMGENIFRSAFQDAEFKFQVSLVDVAVAAHELIECYAGIIGQETSVTSRAQTANEPEWTSRSI